MSAAQSRARPRLVPEGGAENPAFAAVDPGDTVHATFLFAPSLADAELDAAERAVLRWFAAAEWGGALPELVDESLTPSSLHLAVTGVREVRAAMGALVDALVRARLPVHRVVFARRRADGDRAALLQAMSPASAAQVAYADADEWWRACFDRKAAPPVSEDLATLAHDDDAILEIARTTFVERRSMPLSVAGVRICWGLGELAFAEPDARTRDVARVLKMALRARFGAAHDGQGHEAPLPYDRRHGAGSVDRIVTRDKVGYAFAFPSHELREFLHGHAFRYREHELMLAARDVLSVMRLEPVVCWRRFSGRYVLQLWERPTTTRAYAAA